MMVAELIAISERLYAGDDCDCSELTVTTLQVDLDLVKQSLLDPAIAVSAPTFIFPFFPLNFLSENSSYEQNLIVSSLGEARSDRVRYPVLAYMLNILMA